MKRFVYILTVTTLFIIGSAVTVQAQNKPQRTSSARAAYGTQVPQFKSHKKRNEKSKKKARKSAKRKNQSKDKKPYRRGMPI